MWNSISILLSGKYRKQFLIFSSHWTGWGLHSVGRKFGVFGWSSVVVVELVEVQTSLDISPVVIVADPVLVVGVVLVLQGLFSVSQSEGETDGQKETGRGRARHQHLE